MATHEVRNRVPPLEGYDVLGTDRVLLKLRTGGATRQTPRPFTSSAGSPGRPRHTGGPSSTWWRPRCSRCAWPTPSTQNGLARLYREAPLNSIWEGSGNVNALDVLRAVGREPPAVEALEKELALSRGLDRRLDDAIAGGLAALAASVTLQASLLVRFSPAVVAEAFLGSRLTGDQGHTSGTLGPCRWSTREAWSTAH